MTALVAELGHKVCILETLKIFFKEAINSSFKWPAAKNSSQFWKDGMRVQCAPLSLLSSPRVRQPKLQSRVLISGIIKAE